MADRKVFNSMMMRLNREEWMIGGMLLLMTGVFQYLLIAKFLVLFAPYSDANWNIFMRNFHMSGFDPYAYTLVAEGVSNYDTFRHPLLPLLLYPLYGINLLLGMLTDVNCAQFVVGALMSVCTFFSAVFLYRILRGQVGIDKWLAALLVVFFFGFAYILLAAFLPDHFGLSLCCLLLVLSRAGEKMKNGSKFSTKEAFFLTLLTAGVTLTNGIIVVLAVWITNGRPFLTLRNILLTSVLPFVLLFMVAAATDFALSQGVYLPENPVNHQLESTEVGASRWKIVVENFFGESIQLHRKQILRDVLVNRPVIVTYSWEIQYVVEAIIVVLFLAGIWCGRRSLLMWLCMACFAFTILLHLAVAFGINEVYIMAAHWAYVIPIAIAFLWTKTKKVWLYITTLLVFSITIYLWWYHGVLLYNYLTWPLRM